MKYVLWVAVVTAGLTACSKNKCCELVSEKSAVIKWYGAPAADGCDWVISMDNAIYHPEQVLDTAFTHDGLVVTITFQITDKKYGCGNLVQGSGLPVVHVVDIKK